MSTTARYIVAGMTCGHCVSAVTDELTGLDGVQAVEVDLVAGGESMVAVTSARPLAEADVRGAVEEAGYELAAGRTP
jgi:copper chaperone